MSEHKVNEQHASQPFDTWMKDLIQKCIDEKQGNDGVTLTIDTILNRISKEFIHRNDIIICAHVIADDKGNGRPAYIIGTHPRYMIEQCQSRLNHEISNVYNFMTMIAEKRRQESKKSGLIVPGGSELN